MFIATRRGVSTHLLLELLASQCVLLAPPGELLDGGSDSEGKGGGAVTQSLFRCPQAALQE